MAMTTERKQQGQDRVGHGEAADGGDAFGCP